METTIVYWGNMGIMENKMETTIGRSWHGPSRQVRGPIPDQYWGHIGIMKKKMQTTIICISHFSRKLQTPVPIDHFVPKDR